MYLVPVFVLFEADTTAPGSVLILRVFRSISCCFCHGVGLGGPEPRWPTRQRVMLTRCCVFSWLQAALEALSLYLVPVFVSKQTPPPQAVKFAVDSLSIFIHNPVAVRRNRKPQSVLVDHLLLFYFQATHLMVLESCSSVLLMPTLRSLGSYTYGLLWMLAYAQRV